MAKSVKRIAFSDEKIFLLIDLYREKECLWDIKSPDYKHNVKRKAAFTYISEKIELSEEIVKKKINSIRSTYLLEKKKIFDSRPTGTGTDDLYIPSVPWFEHMTFLNDVIIPRKTTSNLDSQITQDEAVGEDEGSQQQCLEDTAVSPSPETDYNTITPNPANKAQEKRTPTQREKKLPPYYNVQDTPRQSQAKKKKTGTSVHTSIDTAINKLCGLSDQDIFDNFGNLIASQLRSIPMDEALQLQTDISEMVNRRLMAVYKAKSTSSIQASRSVSQTSTSTRRSPTYTIQDLEPINYETSHPSSSSSTNQDIRASDADFHNLSPYYVDYTVQKSSNEACYQQEQYNTNSDSQLQEV